ncbi:MAG: ABC transporter ATP-binding protein [Candidatus Hodarchaeota archaeon]
MSTLLDVNQISVWYGQFQVLRNVSLKLIPGESIGLFGPNGHGKSTILKTISGLLRPSKGNITFEGKSINKLHPKEIVRLGIVHVPQGHQLFPRMTVLENLYLGAYTPSAWKKRNENLQKVLGLFPHLEGRKNQLCSSLSGGERQMVAIGRGLMADSKVLMLDEPSLGLAPKLKERVMEAVEKIKELGNSLILVEQDVNYVLRLSDRIYLIAQGEVVAEDRGEALLSNDQIREAYFGRI